MEIAIFLSLLDRLGNVDMPFLMTNGGPLNLTNVWGVFIFQASFGKFDLGYGASLGVLLFLVGRAVRAVVRAPCTPTAGRALDDRCDTHRRRPGDGGLPASSHIDAPRSASMRLLLAIASYALLPAYWTVMTTVRPVSELMGRFPSWIPGGIQLDRFVNVWGEVPLASYMFNSVIVVSITVLVAVTMAGLAGYALSRFEFPGNGLIVAIILFTQAIPTVVALVPFYFILNSLGLINTRVALPISYTVWAVPFATLAVAWLLQDGILA